MSANLASLYGQEFATSVSLLLQTKGSKLRPYVTEGRYKGEQASPVDQMGAVEAQEVTSRFAPMGRVDAAVDRRWVFPTSYDLPQLIDSLDKLRMISDPQGQYVQNAIYGLGRKMDDVILSAMFGTAKTGKSGSTSTSFLSTNIVGLNTGGTNSFLNVAKIRAGKKLLMGNEVDLDNDPIYCAITSEEHDNLLNEIQITSRDFNDKPVLVDGKIDSFLGVKFIHCERIATSALGTDDQSTSSSSKQIPMWAKSGMHLGVWEDIVSDVAQRKDIQSLPWQVYLKMTIGATRIEEKKIVKIWSAA
jgi:hypothetical protein